MCRTVRLLSAVALGLLFTLVGGCLPSGKVRTRVSGTVTAGGQPVKVGKITFRSVGDGRTHSDTFTDGRYAVRSRFSLPDGQYDVTIQYSSTGSRKGYDRTHTERVTAGGLGRDVIDFHLK